MCITVLLYGVFFGHPLYHVHFLFIIGIYEPVIDNDIQDIAISTNNYVNNAIKELDTQESAIQELNAQNKILVDNTISGQKLALSICSDN